MFDPDAREKRMAAHTYEVEELDLAPAGFGGLTFNGYAYIEVEDDGSDWYVGQIIGQGEFYDMQPGGMGHTIAQAIYANDRMSGHITDRCYYHGED